MTRQPCAASATSIFRGGSPVSFLSKPKIITHLWEFPHQSYKLRPIPGYQFIRQCKTVMNPTRTPKLTPSSENSTTYRGGSGKLQINHSSGLPVKTSPQISQLSLLPGRAGPCTFLPAPSRSSPVLIFGRKRLTGSHR